MSTLVTYPCWSAGGAQGSCWCFNESDHASSILQPLFRKRKENVLPMKIVASFYMIPYIKSLASLVNMQAMSNTSRNHTQTMNPLSIFFFIADVNTCLSAALSNQDTCLEGFQQEEMWIVISPTKYNKHQRSYPNWSEIPWQCSRPCSATPAWKILVYTVNRGIILQCLNLLHKP